MLVNKDIFNTIIDKKLILNKSLLKEKDIKDFEMESHSTVTCNVPPLNDRADNKEALKELIEKLELQK